MVRLYTKKCFDDIFEPVAGKWWACEGASKTKVDICMRDAPGRCPGGECKSIRLGSTVDFSGGYKVRATGKGGTGLETYADVDIIPPAYAPTPPTEVGTIPIEILIPNKDGTYKSFPFNVVILAAVPEVEIPEVCTEGEEQTATCPDGTIVVTHICERGPITGINRWVPTGRPCPEVKIPEVCTVGEEQTVRCADGTGHALYRSSVKWLRSWSHPMVSLRHTRGWM
jgi:hypothetical protein